MVKFCNKKGFYCPKYSIKYVRNGEVHSINLDQTTDSDSIEDQIDYGFLLENNKNLFFEIDLTGITEYEILSYLKLKFEFSGSSNTNYVIKFKSFSGTVLNNNDIITNPDLEFDYNGGKNLVEYDLTKLVHQLLESNGIIKIKMSFSCSDNTKTISIRRIKDSLVGAFDREKDMLHSEKINDYVTTIFNKSTTQVIINLKPYDCTYKGIPILTNSYLVFNYDSLQPTEQLFNVVNYCVSVFNDEKIILTDCLQFKNIYYLVDRENSLFKCFENGGSLIYNNESDVDNYYLLLNDVTYIFSKNNNRLIGISKNNILLIYNYNEDNILTTITQDNNVIVECSYDNDSGKLTNISYRKHGNKNISIKYNSSGYLEKYEINEGSGSEVYLSLNTIEYLDSKIIFTYDKYNEIELSVDENQVFKIKNVITNDSYYLKFNDNDKYLEIYDEKNNVNKRYYNSLGNIIYNVEYKTYTENNIIKYDIVKREFFNQLNDLSINTKNLNVKNYFSSQAFDLACNTNNNQDVTNTSDNFNNDDMFEFLDEEYYCFNSQETISLRTFNSTVDISGKANEKISISVLGKINLIYNYEFFKIKAKVYYKTVEEDYIKEYELDFNRVSTEYQFQELQFVTLNDYYKIDFIVEYLGGDIAYFSNVYINKVKNDGNLIYNNNMELVGISNGSNVIQFKKYKDNNDENIEINLIKNENGTIIESSKENQLLVSTENLINNNETCYEYEDNNIVQKVSIEGDYKFVEKYSYNTNNEIECHHKNNEYEYYLNKVYNNYKINQTAKSNGFLYKTIVDYESDDVINMIESNNLQEINKYYYENGLLKTIEADYIHKFEFLYDEKNRIRKVSYNNISYIEYSYVDDLISVKKYNDLNQFNFVYDIKGRIISINYANGTTSTAVSSFEYDDLDRISIIRNGNNEIEYQYVYDDLNNVIKEVNKDITISYDVDNNIKAKNYLINNTSLYFNYSYSTYNESINNLFSKLADNIYCDYLYPTKDKSFLYSDSLNFDASLEYDEKLKINIYNFNYPSSVMNFNILNINRREDNTQYKNEIFDAFKYLVKTDLKTSILGFIYFPNNTSDLIYKLIKKDVNENGDVELIEDIQLIINDEEEVIVKYYLDDEVISRYTGLYINKNKWNIIGINVGNDPNNEYIEVIVNDKIYTCYYESKYFTIQYVQIGEVSNTKMKLAYLTVGSRDINEEELRILYNDFNEIFNDKNNNFNVNVTNYERFIVDGSDKVTLNNTFKTIRGDEPTIVYTDIKYCNSLERYFKYSTELNKYCYVPTKYKHSYLQYDIKYNSYPFLFVKGLFKPFSKENGEYYTLFTITSKQTNEELLKVSYKHPLFYVYRKGLERQDSSENVVALSYDRFNKIMIQNLDDALYLKINNHLIEFDSTLINEDVNIIIGNDSDNNAFSGLISDLEFGYSALNDIDFKTSFINKFDSQGRLRNKIIKLNNNEEIKTIYSYYDEVNEDNTKTLNSLCGRIKNYDGTEEIIEYNDNNSIIKRVIISNNKIIKIINYVYDDFNRLIEQVEYYVNDNDTLLEKYKYIYEYDTFGNIIKSKEYFESNLIKDLKYIYTLDYTNRLIKVIDDTDDSITNIEYNNSLYPNNINNNVLEYQGNRLIRYNDVTYEYDTLGKRTKKIKSNNNENYIVNYYYENDNLVRQVKNNVTIDYIYNNNIIEGLVYDNKEYYYVRDITGCIEKIIDKNKKTMVLYRYSSYGEVYSTLGDSLTSSEETIAETLRNNNGFVYKGYYYDVETGLFWISSRYYNPEWGRWISPDDIEYLDPESVNGLNLYCYCGNDPINIANNIFVNNSFDVNNPMFIGNTFNESLTSNSKKTKWFLGWYRGVPVFKAPFSLDGRPYSFGGIFLSDYYYNIYLNSPNDIKNTLNHEWGHTRQLLLLGIGDYFNMIAIPSILDLGPGLYINKPWEITADMFGGVIRSDHTKIAKQIGLVYLGAAEFLSNTIVKPMLFPIYSSAAALLDGIIPGLGTTLLTIIYTS